VIRICYVVDAPFLGGAELYVSRLATALNRRRFAPSVLMKSGSADPSLSAWADELRAQNVDMMTLPMRLPFHPVDAIAMWRHFERTAPHVVHVNMPGPYDGQMGLVLPLAKASGARTVVTEHLPMVATLWKRATIKRLGYRTLDLAVTMTQSNARFLVDRQAVPPARIRVVPNGVPRSYGVDEDGGRARRFALGLRDSQLAVIYIGNILLHKGLRRLIEAISSARSRERIRLFVAGAGPDEGACRQLATDRGLAGSVVFLGRQSAQKVEELLGAGDVLALPSEIEGLPYVVLEAMASARAVIAGRVYGLPEVVEDGVTGILVEPTRSDEIAESLDRLAEDPDMRRRMGEAGRARFEQYFTLEEQVRQMESLYERLVHGRERSGDGT
jgi:glycosyltransferase involved in cell wall biosynthesis